MNVFSFLTFNVAGDDENVFMHIVKKDLAHYEANHGKNSPDKAWTTSVERLRRKPASVWSLRSHCDFTLVNI